VPAVWVEIGASDQILPSAAPPLASLLIKELMTLTIIGSFPRMLLVECWDSACAAAVMAGGVHALNDTVTAPTTFGDPRNTTTYGGVITVREADGDVGHQDVFYFQKEHDCVTLLVSQKSPSHAALQLLFIRERLLPDANGELVLKAEFSPRARPFAED
jgi:hypothetical protein